MPPVGLLNDPNGVIYWKGSYHVFFQWQPFQTGHGAKFWGHYTTQDVVNWKREEIALAPSDWFDKNGCYSGSAVTKDDRLYLFTQEMSGIRMEIGKRINALLFLTTGCPLRKRVSSPAFRKDIRRIFAIRRYGSMKAHGIW